VRPRYLAWREPFVCSALPAIIDDETLPSWAGGGSVDGLLREALHDALDRLEQHLGAERSAWRWGAMHRVRFAHPLARMAGLDPIFVAADHEFGGDEQTVLQGGFDARDGFDAVVVPSYRVIVDVGDVDGARAVLPTGVSGHPGSPHWNDQAASWIAGELRPAPVSRAAIDAAAQHVLRLAPE
jgi:penicillin G amidase